MWPSCHAHAFGVTLHVVQRGYARAACFFCERDRRAYVHFLRGYAERCACALHAYVLIWPTTCTCSSRPLAPTLSRS